LPPGRKFKAVIPAVLGEAHSSRERLPKVTAQLGAEMVDYDWASRMCRWISTASA